MIAELEPAPALDDDDEVRLPDGSLCEFVDGELVGRVMSHEATEVGVEIGFRFRTHLERDRIARVFGSEGQYRCFPHAPKQVRKPDVSVILRSRLSQGLPRGICPFAPDLAVEVVSPNDSFEDIADRARDFRLAGTPLVWVAYPKHRSVYVHSANGIREFGPDDVIDAEPVLPGFQAKVGDFFFAEPE